jgi:hypothetical protein
MNMKNIQIILGSGNMGDVSEADYDAWTSYVAEHIDDRCGFVVDEVLPRRFGETGDDSVRGATEEQREIVNEALRALWDDFCADASAWPTSDPAGLSTAAA